jgi:predicted CXXCH cytochrome family protein
VSCHSLHASDPNDQLAKDMDGNRACLQCHDELADEVAAHAHHAPGSPGTLCYNCHMPNTTWALSTAMRSHRIDSPNIERSARTGRPNACNLCHLDKTLAWSSQKLSEWFGAPKAELDAEQQQLSAAVSWLIKGNAIQRAIAAWHMGWAPAQRATGTGFQAALLAEMLDDPYSQVRFVAGKALQRQPGFDRFEYDFIASREQRERAAQAAREILSDHGVLSEHRLAAVLIGPDGELRRDQLLQLRAQRDETPIDVPE